MFTGGHRVTLPSLKEAAVDPEVSAGAFRLLAYLHGTLSATEFKRVKYWAVAERVRLKRRNIARYLATLVRMGYLQQGPKLEHNVATFMLVAERIRPEPPSPGGARVLRFPKKNDPSSDSAAA